VSTRILITGMNAHDSGKTTFAIQYLDKLLKDGYSVEYFKPISGHNYWYHNSHTRTCVELGQLFSLDAKKVRQQYSSKVHIYTTNPIHTLYVPAKIERPSQVYFTTTLALAGWDAVLIMKRISQSSEKGVHSVMLVANSLLADDLLLISREEVDKLSSSSEIIPISTMEEIYAFEEQCLESRIQTSFEYLENSAEIIVIESFNNSAWPWENLDYVDKVFTVGPGHIFQYDPERFRKATFMLKRGSLPIREVTLNRVDDLLKPVLRIPLAPLKGLPESIKQMTIE
jgi:predicted P-loop ATPase/GTPase